MMPNFFIVGAAKSATTSVDRYLNEHPKIFMSPRKETHYFATDAMPREFKGMGDESLNQLIVRDRSQYEGLFVDVKSQLIVGESSVYYMYYATTVTNIFSEIPDAKILIVLRNPIDRAFSAYLHLVKDEREVLEFEKSMELEQQRRDACYEPMWLFKELGLYYTQVKRYIDVFGREKVKVIFFEELEALPQKVLDEIFTFLGVEPYRVNTSVRYNPSGRRKFNKTYDFVTQPHPIKSLIKFFIPEMTRKKIQHRVLNVILDKPVMNENTRKSLAEFFFDDVRKLEKLLDTNLGEVWGI